MKVATFPYKSTIFRGMGEETWRDRLRKAVETSGKSMREISIASGHAPGYLFGVLRDEKDPTIDNLLALIKVIDGSAIEIIHGIELSPEDEQILRIFNSLSESQRVAFLQWAEAFRPLSS